MESGAADYRGEVDAFQGRGPITDKKRSTASFRRKAAPGGRSGSMTKLGGSWFFMKTHESTYHRRVRSRDDLHVDKQIALRKASMVDRRGNIPGGGQ
jgi:hypothetical protein